MKTFTQALRHLTISRSTNLPCRLSYQSPRWFRTAMSSTKAKVLIVGGGGVGTMAAYALETGGKASVTMVMRSNFAAVEKNGISIDSIEHGHDISGWRPSNISKSVPSVGKGNSLEFDYILVTTKNIPDVPPSIADLIAPAVTPGKTAIVLSQNGINIEKSILPAFPRNPIISSVSTIGATEQAHGVIFHDDNDAQKIGAFTNPGVPAEVAEAAAKRYIDIYNGKGNLDIIYEPDVAKTRWRKLVYNASYNSVATILRMDTTRLRMSQYLVDDLIKPIMLEIQAAARAADSPLPDGLEEIIIRADPTNTHFKPSMCQDIEKGNFIELENIVGEPLREGTSRGVPMPTLKVVYGILKGLQLQTKEARGLWKPKFEGSNPYS